MKEKDCKPDNTAVRTALWRALHVRIDDKPAVFEDEIGLQLVAPPGNWRERPDMKYTQSIRASIVARARFIEDLTIEQSRSGISQYVILGAGLDTFAQRRPDIASTLEIFEIDQPDTLNWKQKRFVQTGYTIPDNLHYVKVNFEKKSWWNALLKAGFSTKKPALIVCTGVTLYLTKNAIMDSLKKIKSMPPGSTLAMTFNLPLQLVDEADKPLIEMSIKGAQVSGTPMISFFSPEQVVEMAEKIGFGNIQIISTKDMKEQYFANRKDGLVPASGEFFLTGKT